MVSTGCDVPVATVGHHFTVLNHECPRSDVQGRYSRPCTLLVAVSKSSTTLGDATCLFHGSESMALCAALNTMEQDRDTQSILSCVQRGWSVPRCPVVAWWMRVKDRTDPVVDQVVYFTTHHQPQRDMLHT